MTAIAAAAHLAGVDHVITTAKDEVRLERFQPLPFTLTVAALTLAFDPPDTLFACIDAALARKRTPA